MRRSVTDGLSELQPKTSILWLGRLNATGSLRSDFICTYYVRGPDSLVTIGIIKGGFIPGGSERFFSSSKTFRPIRPLTQLVPRVLSSGIQWPGREGDQSFCL